MRRLVGSALISLLVSTMPALAQETACDHLAGRAFALCMAFCEVRDCDVDPRPGCAKLHRAFERLTGASFLPCQLCGNGVLDPGEVCDPGDPTSTSCAPRACRADCTCECGQFQGTPICDGGCPPGMACLAPPGSGLCRCVAEELACEQQLPDQCLQGFCFAFNAQCQSFEGGCACLPDF